MRYLGLLFCILLFSCTPQTSQEATFYVFGTTVKIILPDVKEQEADRLFNDIQQQLQAMHRQWHAWQTSEITAINGACVSGLRITISPGTKDLILLSQQYEQASLGYFNPAIGGLIAAWGYLDDDFSAAREQPTQTNIDTLLHAKPSMQDLKIDGDQLHCTNSQLRLDFGGIAKGYATEEIMQFLRAEGVQHALVDAGGDVQTMGKRQGKPWQIAVNSPGRDKPLAVLAIANDESVFTSGSYERAVSEVHHHIIDPLSGKPSQTFISATVISEDPVLADAAATALLAANATNWQAIVKNFGNIAVILVNQQGDIIVSPAADSYL
jgi:thiamine biosynthesis lipoprotein